MKQFLIAMAVIFSTVTMSCNDNAQKAATIQKSIDNANAMLQNLNNSLVQAKGNLEVAQDRLEKTKEFHLFRSTEDRENQIREAVKVKDDCEKEVQKISTTISQLNNSVAVWQSDLRK